MTDVSPKKSKQRAPGHPTLSPTPKTKSQAGAMPGPKSQGQGKKPLVPPARANAPATQAKQCCPGQVVKPCDVTNLKLVVRYTKPSDASDKPTAGAPDERKTTVLQCATPLRRAKISALDRAAIGPKTAALLGEYDILIESVAAFAMFEKRPEAAVDIDVAAFFPNQCSAALHPIISMSLLTRDGRVVAAPVKNSLLWERVADVNGELVTMTPPPQNGVSPCKLGPASFKSATLKLAEVHALTAHFDLDADNALSKFLRFVMFFVNINRSIDIVFRAESCGYAVVPRIPNKDLCGLVRIYRDVSVSFGITLPLGNKVTEVCERGQTTTRKTEYRATFQGGSGVGFDSKKSAVTGMTDLTMKDLPAGQFALYLKLNEFTIALGDDASWAERAEGFANRKAAFAKTVKNAKEQARYQAWLASHASLRQEIKVAWDGLVSGIKGVRGIVAGLAATLKKAPQLGLKLEYEATFLSGSLVFTWSRTGKDGKESTAAALSHRYAPLEHSGKIELKIQLFDIKFKPSFGVMLDFRWLAKAEARIKGEFGIAVDVALAIATHEPAQSALNGTGTCSLEAYLVAEVVGITLVKGRVGVETGLVAEGILKYDGGVSFKYEAKLRTLPLGWFWEASDIATGVVRGTVHRIFEGKVIWSASGTVL